LEKKNEPVHDWTGLVSNPELLLGGDGGGTAAAAANEGNNAQSDNQSNENSLHQKTPQVF